MTPSNYNFNDQYSGDTFDGITFELEYIDTGLPVDLTGCEVNIEFRYGKDNTLFQKRFTIGEGIIMVNASGGIVRLEPFDIDWPPRMYVYDMEFVYPNDEVKTYLRGTMKVVPDITQNNE